MNVRNFLLIIFALFQVFAKGIVMMPAMLIILGVSLFFGPEQLLMDIVNTFTNANMIEKIALIKIILKASFVFSFIGCAINSLIRHPQYAVADIYSIK